MRSSTVFFSSIILALSAHASTGMAQTASSAGSVASGSSESPTTPTQVTGKADTSTAITLTWIVAREAGIKGYSIDRCEGERASCMFFNVVGTSKTRTYTDKDLSPGTTYNYRVQSEGDNMYSAIVTVTTPETDAKAAPAKASH